MTIPAPKQKRTKKQKESTPLKSEFILGKVKEVSALRSKDREFHGLEREFIYHQDRILKEYEESKDLKHPRDIGTAREVILRSFLQTSGYMPRKYGISETSARVISPSGHSSNEIDILIYDAANSISLMSRQGIYEAYPIECVYGVIQVKSKLTKNEIKNGLKNISSFKSLRPPHDAALNDKGGFGLLFAYDSDMEWIEIVKEIESYAKVTANNSWCNAIYILNKGCIFHGTDTLIAYGNSEIEKIIDLQMHGMPDHWGSCLYHLYSTLRQLLDGTKTKIADVDSYFRLPLVSGIYSYKFASGFVSELATCEKHGSFQKKVSENNLERIVAFALKAKPINWIQATDIAYGGAGDNYEQYERQPGDVRIYNPEVLPLSDVLLTDSTFGEKQVKSLAFDAIDCAGIQIWIPYYYSHKEHIMEPCSKCRTSQAKRK
jgi:hypothetical protein